MPTFDFEGRGVEYEPGDTVATALYRAGVRTFSRSFKFHRRRGLYCLSGDCPNCLCRVDGAGEVPACMTSAEGVASVEREGGWPSVERDALSLSWRVRRLLPVGFYYKLVLGQRSWRPTERFLRRVAGRSTVPEAPEQPEQARPLIHLHPDLLVIGGGPAGLAAALAGAEAGQRVLLLDETKPGLEVTPGPTAEEIHRLSAEVAAQERIELLTEAAAVAIHEGPTVPVRAREESLLVHPQRVVVATGAVECHRLFPGNDLPGVWLARGASRMVGGHGLSIGARVVVWGETAEAWDHVRTLESGGARVVRLLLEGEAAEAGQHEALRIGGKVVAAHGRRAVRAVMIDRGASVEKVRCDALVIASDRTPRDSLLRQASGIAGVVGAGETVDPGCGLEAAIESGRAAVRAPAAEMAGPERALVSGAECSAGIACLCEDIRAEDLAAAWSEGYRSTELLKRYSTMTMGPCQGAMCHHHLQAFVANRSESSVIAAATTARPPARPLQVCELAAGPRRSLEERTRLHAIHAENGSRWEWAGSWRRPSHYGDVEAEYRAVRERVGIMDVSTLGKLHVAGRDAVELLERVYPCRIGDLEPGRMRYGLLLNEAGYIVDDGVICALAPESFFLTFTTTGVDGVEAWLRRWAGEWSLRVNIINETRSLGAINLAGPNARDVIQSLSEEDVSNEALPYLQHRQLDVAGVSCRVVRLGFVGELGYELHHRAADSERLWRALSEAGGRYEIKPHGLEAVSMLRLEKGHIIVGQDTDFDTTPYTAGMPWAVRPEKDFFLGKAELERLAGSEPRRLLRGVSWDGSAPPEGTVLSADGRAVGAVTSSGEGWALGHGVSLAWIDCGEKGSTPERVEADSRSGRVCDPPFYDPEGARQRA